MNTARQLLWLPTTREEKYKAKQAIDTFFVRGGDVLSAAVVFVGTAILHLTVAQFAAVNIVLTLVWLGDRAAHRPSAVDAAARADAADDRRRGAASCSSPSRRRPPRRRRAKNSSRPRAPRRRRSFTPYEPTPLERRILTAEGLLGTKRPVYPFIGSVFEGGGLAVGPGYRARFADSGTFDAHAAWSARNYKAVSAQVRAARIREPAAAGPGPGRLARRAGGRVLRRRQRRRSDSRRDYAYRSTTIGASARLQAAKFVAVGARHGLPRHRRRPMRARPTSAAARSPSSTGARRLVHQARRPLPRRLVRLSRRQVRRCATASAASTRK